MSARIVVTLILEYAGNDTASYDEAIDDAKESVASIAEEVAAKHETVRVVEVQVSG